MVAASARKGRTRTSSGRSRGGGNFGVVTSFEFGLHPVGPEVLAGLLVHPLAAAGGPPSYRDFLGTRRGARLWFVLRKAPPLPFLPVDGTARRSSCWRPATPATWRRARASQAPARLRKPHRRCGGPHPYAAWQAIFDPLLAPGARNYWKSHNFRSVATSSSTCCSTTPGDLPIRPDGDRHRRSSAARSTGCRPRPPPIRTGRPSS